LARTRCAHARRRRCRRRLGCHSRGGGCRRRGCAPACRFRAVRAWRQWRHRRAAPRVRRKLDRFGTQRALRFARDIDVRLLLGLPIAKRVVHTLRAGRLAAQRIDEWPLRPHESARRRYQNCAGPCSNAHRSQSSLGSRISSDTPVRALRAQGSNAKHRLRPAGADERLSAQSANGSAGMSYRCDDAHCPGSARASVWRIRN